MYLLTSWKSTVILTSPIVPHNHIARPLHSMDSRDCPISIRTATHNIIGLGIKTLTMFPITDSSNSPQKSLKSFRQQFRKFIKNAVESKINAHLQSKHGPDPDLLPALRSSLASELSIWTIMHDNNPASAPRSHLVRLHLRWSSVAVNFIILFPLYTPN